MGFDMKELRRLERALGKVSKEIASGAGPAGGTAKRILKLVADVDRKQNIQTFKREQAPRGGIGAGGFRGYSAASGSRWKNLSKKYAAWKRANSSSRKKLVLTKDMKRSLTTRAHGERIERLRGNTITLGTSHDLAAIHMSGVNGVVTVPGHTRNDPRADRGQVRVRGYAYRQRLPARPMVGKTKGQREELARAIEKIVTDRIGSLLMPLPVGIELKKAANASTMRPRPTRW